MKVNDSIPRIQALAKMTRAALKIWQFVARFSTKLTLCQGLEGDLMMAKNSRRVSVDKTPFNNDSEKEPSIAFDDKRKLINPEMSLFIPGPQVQVVALADWESAPTFVLDEQWGKRVPVASKDSLLNKCNPFLSDNRSIKRLQLKDYDNMSEAPTMSTDCSSIPESSVDTDEMEDHQEGIEDKEEVVPVTADDNIAYPMNSDESVGAGIFRQSERCKRFFLEGHGLTDAALEQSTAKQAKSVNRSSRWVCVGHGRYAKVDSQEQLVANVAPKPKTSRSVRWVCVGYGRYEKHFV
ncbi:hypothetical protein PHYBOEH_012082 [Phytophthora boehmeriae]|uniref:Uncharacterized protein n=1 Tax=Phytophthora boehmeriae TaxID=109152 RepID=A0A8T1X268_9STRA|nr:hypothetical protein PHYBOEH_012082 [Phytophthora boehmeriae]